MKNYVNLSTKNVLYDFILANKNYFLKMYDNNYLNLSSMRDISLFFLMTDSLHEEEINLIKDYFIGLKNTLEKDNFTNIGLINGLTEDLFVVDYFRRKTGGLNNFYNNLKEEIIIKISSYIYNFKINKTQIDYYDLISGVSGLLYFLLNREPKNSGHLKPMIEYLIFLCSDKKYNNLDLINFHIEKDPLEPNFSDFGYINFSLSHGMLSSLIALSTAKYKEYAVYGLDESIKKLLNIYDEYMKNMDGFDIWPTQLDAKNYSRGYWDISEDPRNPFSMSWCYGSLSIDIGLSKVYRLLNNTKKSEYYKEQFIKYIYRNPDYYNRSIDT